MTTVGSGTQISNWSAQHAAQRANNSSTNGLKTRRKVGNNSLYMYSVHGCAVLLCLVCLFDLACFFLSSFSSLIKNMYTYSTHQLQGIYDTFMYMYAIPLHLMGTMYVLIVQCTCTQGSSFFLGKVTALGVLCCFALFVCLTLLACFFLSSFSSLI